MCSIKLMTRLLFGVASLALASVAASASETTPPSFASTFSFDVTASLAGPGVYDKVASAAFKNGMVQSIKKDTIAGPGVYGKFVDMAFQLPKGFTVDDGTLNLSHGAAGPGVYEKLRLTQTNMVMATIADQRSKARPFTLLQAMD